MVDINDKVPEGIENTKEGGEGMAHIHRIKIAVLMVVVISLCSFPAIAYATSTQEKLDQAKQEKEQLQQQIDANQENLEELKEERNTLQGELNVLNGNLTEISENLEELENQIDSKEEEIVVTTERLNEAISQADGQYESMKIRIQFMYERGDATMLEIFLNAGSFAEMINAAEYIEELTTYDRTKLEEYKEIRNSIQELQEQQIAEKQELDALKVKVEAEKARVSGLVSQTKNNISQYSSQISDAEEAALAYEAEMKKKEEDIKYLQKKLEEEKRLSQLAANSTRRDISEITFAEGDRYLLANLIYCEAGGEPYEGQVAVGAVVINRVLSSVFPDTVVGVIYAKRQFSPVASGRLAIALAENKATASCYRAADEAMAGYTNVGGCVFFRTPIPGLSGINIGGHVFY